MAEPEIPEALEKNKEAKEVAGQIAADQIAAPQKGEVLLSSIGYISFLCILPLVLLRESKFGQHHGKQALVMAIFLYFLDVLQLFPASFVFLYMIFKVTLVLYCVVMSAKGRYFKLPFLYDLSQRFNISIKDEEKK